MPQDVFSDGFVNLCIDTSLNIAAGTTPILVEGQYVPNILLAQPIVPDVKIQIDSPLYIDQMFTAGSVLAEGLKVIFAQCPQGLVVNVLPRLDNAAAVKSAYTLTVAGPATSAGVVEYFMGQDKWAVSVNVALADTAATIATNLAAAIPADFPYTAVVAANVITLTAKNGGTVGNFFNPVYNWQGLQNFAPSGVSITVAQTVVGATDPVAISYQNALGVCCFSVYALLCGDALLKTNLRDWIRSQWACNVPQCFGHGYVYDNGTVGQVLAAGDGHTGELNRLAYPVNDVNYPWMLTANQAALRACTVVANPELSMQGTTYGLMSAVWRPESCVAPWSYVDQLALVAAGFNVYGPAQGGQGSLTNPYVYNDVTNWILDSLNRPNYTFQGTNSRFLTAATAIEVATQLKTIQGLGLYTKNTKVAIGTKGTNVNMIYASFVSWARSKVGTLFSEFTNYQKDITLQSDFDKASPCYGKPGVLWLRMKYRPPVRIVAVNTSLAPALLDNCVR